MGTNDEQHEGLSEEEIAALEDDESEVEGSGGDDDKDLSESDKDADTKSDQDVKDKDADGKDEAGDKKTGTDDVSSTTDDGADTAKKSDDGSGDKTTDGADAGTGDEKEKTAPEQKPFVPKFTGPDKAVVDDLETKVKDAKAKFDDAEAKFDEGEIDYQALDKMKDEWRDVKDEWREAKIKFDVAHSMGEDTDRSKWEWEQDRFYEDFSDFDAKNNATLHSAFIATVNRVIHTPEASKMTDRQVLLKAKEQVEKDLGIASSANSDKSNSEKQAALDKAKKGNADRSKLGADIGGLPAAEDEGTDGTDEFAYLDKLEGEKFELAVAKLSEEQLEKYMDRKEK